MEYSTSPAAAVRPLLEVRQTRAFSDSAVDDDALIAIADAARWSGSRSNRQPWRFVIVRGRDDVRRMGEVGAPDAKTLATAPAAIAVVLPQDKSAAISNAFDEGRAAERILIAAERLGLGAGIAWIGSEERPAVAELLGVPEGWFVRTIIAIGHPADPAERAADRSGARLARSETVFEDRWGR